MDRGALQATVLGILQARILEWVAISFSREENGTQITQIITEHKSWRMNLCKINNKPIKMLLQTINTLMLQIKQLRAVVDGGRLLISDQLKDQYLNRYPQVFSQSKHERSVVRKKLEFLSPCSYQLLRKLASESKTLNNTSASFVFNHK